MSPLQTDAQRPPKAWHLRLFPALAAVAAAALLAGCGESKEQKAEKKVCSAKSSIAANVSSLKSLPVAASSVEKAAADVTAIGEDLKAMKAAAPDLSSAKKEEVEKGTEQFRKQAGEALEGLKSGGTAATAKSELAAALTGLESAYKTALEPIKCS